MPTARSPIPPISEKAPPIMLRIAIIVTPIGRDLDVSKLELEWGFTY
jgi:hypothetical protein